MKTEIPYYERQMQKRADVAEKRWRKGLKPVAKKSKTSKQIPTIVGKPKFVAYFDGCCEPINPGGTAGFGAVVFENTKRVWECSKVFIPINGREKETSNNVAEYAAFNAILDYFIERGLADENILVHGDSKLVIEQCFGRWKIKGGFYAPLAREAKEKVKKFKSLHGKWISREENSIADELSKGEVKRAGVHFRIQPEPDQVNRLAAIKQQLGEL